MKLLIFGRGPYAHAINSAEAWGGAEKQQWLISKELVKRGHEVVIVVNTDDPDSIKPEVQGVRFITCPRGNSIPKLFRIFGEEQPDWYYHRTATYALGPINFVAKIRGVQSVYACAFDKDCIPRQALSSRKWMWPLYKWGLDLADRIFVQHPHQMSLLSQEYQEKAQQVNNIVEVPDETYAKEGYVAWMAAALRHTKRPHLLIEIAKAMPDTNFVVCGAPTHHRSSIEYGEQIIKDLKTVPNIDYRGSVPIKEAYQIIARSAVLLSTSSGEGFPNTMLEAWSSYTPVVSLDVDPGGVVDEHELGYVTHSVNETVMKLGGLMENPAELERLGSNGYTYVSQKHSPQHVCDQLEQALLARSQQFARML